MRGWRLWRIAFSATVSAVAALASADRLALVVGINTYPVISPAGRQLKGAVKDAQRMAGLLQDSGFRTTVLLDARATHDAIEAGISELERARPGDEVVLFFSGRGSLAESGGAGLEPTLAPQDALANSAEKDIRFSRLERLANALASRSANFVLVLDCSYQQPTARARGEFRHYENNPKCLDRTGEARPELFRAPGVVLAACGPRGVAYEWRRDFMGGDWMGAFTDTLTGVIAENFISKRRPTYAEVMSEVCAPIIDRSRNGYMPGFRPSPGPEEFGGLPAPYAKPTAFIPAEVTASTSTPPVAQQVEEERRELGKDFRVGFEMDASIPEAQQGVLKVQIDGAIRKQLESQIGGLKVPSPGSSHPDRLVLLSKTDKGMRAVVSGEPVDEPGEAPAFEGRDLNAILRSGLKDYLEAASFVYQLWRMADSETPTLDAGFKMDSPREQYPMGGIVEVNARATRPGLLYLIDLNESEGIVHLAGAGIDLAAEDPARPNVVESGFELEFYKKSTPGRVVVRGVFVELDRAVRLPKIEEGPKARSSLLNHLRALRGHLKSGKAKWQAAKVVVRIVK